MTTEQEMRRTIIGDTSRRRAIRRIAGLTGLAVSLGSARQGYGQAAGVSVSTGALLKAVPQNVPLVLQSRLAAMGSRFTAPGQERLTIGGGFQAASASAVQPTLIYESPRKFRYQSPGKTITFNSGVPAVAAGKQDPADQGLIESLFEDSFDGFIFNVTNARLLRFLMPRARLDDGRAAGYTGPYLDIFQLTLPMTSLTGAPWRTKHFYFDSTTHLLSRVRYRSGPSGQTQVETLFNGWQQVNGSYAPQVITRSENGALQFTMTCTSWQIGAAGNPVDFTAA